MLMLAATRPESRVSKTQCDAYQYVLNICADRYCPFRTEIFNPMVSAWFGDLGDGVHDGTAEDPRVELIVVEPTEIRYWKKTQTNVGQLVNVAVSAVTGK